MYLWIALNIRWKYEFYNFFHSYFKRFGRYHSYVDDFKLGWKPILYYIWIVWHDTRKKERMNTWKIENWVHEDFYNSIIFNFYWKTDEPLKQLSVIKNRISIKSFIDLVLHQLTVKTSQTQKFITVQRCSRFRFIWAVYGTMILNEYRCSREVKANNS